MVRFRQPKATEPFPTGKPGEVFLFLRLTAECIDRIHHQGPLHGCGGSHAAVSALEFLHHQPITEVVQSPTPVFDRCGRSKAAQFTHLLHDLQRKLPPLGIVLYDRRDILLHVIAHGFPYELVFIGKEIIDVEIIGALEKIG